MEIEPTVRFDDTSVAFSYKSDKELKKADFIFTLVNHPVISKIAITAAKIGLALHLPIKGLIRNTVFDHFCGGENIGQSEKTFQNLARFHVGTILDYSVEGAKTEEGFDSTTNEILLTFDKAKGNNALPFCVFKVTGMASMDLLEKVQAKDVLSEDENGAYTRVKNRVDQICAKAF
ncbi:MAG: proline dehydrogenase, partial [Verrucomicrobia bacterium]|nr:proline dehydrogenase [Cytophagales bacterium]